MTVEHDYQVYGTQLSGDFDMGKWLPAGGEGLSRVKLYETEEPGPTGLKERVPFYSSHGRELFLHTDRPFNRPEPGQPWRFEVNKIITFFWSSGSQAVAYTIGPEGDRELLAFWLIHIFLPFYLSLEADFDFIHAGAVDVSGRTLMFIAPSMGGKSTLTEYFMQQGHALVSDDKVGTVVDGDRIIAIPSHAHYRPYRRFEDLGLRAPSFQDEPQPIQAFYLLQREAEVEEVAIDEVTGFRKFDHLLPNFLFGFPFLKEKRLRYLASLVNSVPVFAVQMPDNLERSAGCIRRHQGAQCWAMTWAKS